MQAVVVASLRHCLTNLLSFRGRTTRATFWPYVAVVMVGWTLVGMTAMLPALLASFAKMERFAAAHPDQATITRGPGSYSIRIEGCHPELLPDIGAFLAIIQVGMVVIVALLAAAVVRRLRDADRRVWWALLPLPFAAVSLVIFPRMFADFARSPAPDLSLFALLVLNNLLYLTSLGLLVVQLARARADGVRFDSAD